MEGGVWLSAGNFGFMEWIFVEWREREWSVRVWCTFQCNDFLRLAIVMTFLSLCLHFIEQVRFRTWSGIEKGILSFEEVGLRGVFISQAPFLGSLPSPPNPSWWPLSLLSLLLPGENGVLCIFLLSNAVTTSSHFHQFPMPLWTQTDPPPLWLLLLLLLHSYGKYYKYTGRDPFLWICFLGRLFSSLLSYFGNHGLLKQRLSSAVQEAVFFSR